MTRSVLVADDDDDVRSLIVLQLAIDGHDVTECATVDSALSYLDAGRFDVVLTDLNFGSDTGERILRRCREIGQPVILMSASVALSGLSPDLAESVVTLEKPFLLDTLSAAVNRAGD